MKLEATMQAALIQWWQYAHKGFGLPDHRVLFMVPNGSYLGSGHKVTAGGKSVPLAVIRFRQLQKMGFVNGVPDLLLIVPRGASVGLAVELKAPAGRLSIDQGQMLALFEQNRWAKIICWSLDEAIGAITRYLTTGNPAKISP